MQLYLRSLICLHCLHTDLSFTFWNYEAPHYAILVSLLLSSFSRPNITDTPSNIFSPHVILIQRWVQIHHTHIKQRMELCHIQCGKILFLEQCGQVRNFKTKCKREWSPISLSKFTWDNLLPHNKGPLYLQFCTQWVHPRSKVATAMEMYMAIFWDMTPCKSVRINQYFGGAYESKCAYFHTPNYFWCWNLTMINGNCYLQMHKSCVSVEGREARIVVVHRFTVISLEILRRILIIKNFECESYIAKISWSCWYVINML